jgi:hypothetical protein
MRYATDSLTPFSGELEEVEARMEGQEHIQHGGAESVSGGHEKISSYFWSIEADCLVLDFDDEPEVQESPAVTPGSGQQKID